MIENCKESHSSHFLFHITEVRVLMPRPYGRKRYFRMLEVPSSTLAPVGDSSVGRDVQKQTMKPRNLLLVWTAAAMATSTPLPITQSFPTTDMASRDAKVGETEAI